MRDPYSPADAAAVADELLKTGHVQLVDSDVAAREAMVDGWFAATGASHSIALVTATHAEAQSINESIQARRLSQGSISAERMVSGQDGQMLAEGDIVQTRRNDSHAGVDNRQTWTIKRITSNHVVLASWADSSDLRKVTTEYVGQHMHLGYASTVYGVQGETTDRSLVGPGVDAAGLYVGLTRGRERNDLILTSSTPTGALTELVEMMQRHTIEESIERSRAAARQELRRSATNSGLAAGKAIAPSLAAVGLER